jgi:hypothetical protein
MILSFDSSRLLRRWGTGLASLALLVVLAGCDGTASDPAGATAETAPPPAVAQALPGDLQLSTSQAASLSKRFGDADTLRAGDLWRLAGELQATLSEEQIRRLTAVPPSRPSMQERRQMRRTLRTMLRNELSDEQRTDLRALWTAHRETVSQLRAKFDAGTLSQAGYFDALKNQRQALRDDARAVLTADQRARLDTLREKGASFRTAHKEARQAVLNLTADQQAELRILLETTLLSVQQVVGDVRAGAIARSEARDALQPIREEARSAAQTILSPQQWELVQVYRGLRATARPSSERLGLTRLMEAGSRG